jgi:hypothetical protein
MLQSMTHVLVSLDVRHPDGKVVDLDQEQGAGFTPGSPPFEERHLEAGSSMVAPGALLVPGPPEHGQYGRIPIAGDSNRQPHCFIRVERA